MPKLIVENERGERIQLTQSPNYDVLSIEGLDPPSANVNIAENANFDGGTKKNSRLNVRNIVITIAIHQPIEQNRIALYRYLKSKRECTLYFSNGTRKVFTKGTVESFEVPQWTNKERAQISILCPNPYLIDTEQSQTSFSVVEPLFEFPFSIPAAGQEISRLVFNKEETIIAGDIETGMDIRIVAVGSAMNPVIYNTETLESLKVNISLVRGDVLRINTNRGQKSITLTRNGITTNVINDLVPGSTWLQLAPGENTLLYSADMTAENLIVNIEYSTLYEGV